MAKLSNVWLGQPGFFIAVLENGSIVIRINGKIKKTARLFSGQLFQLKKTQLLFNQGLTVLFVGNVFHAQMIDSGRELLNR